MMHMVLDFARDVQFIFKTWYAQQDESVGYLINGLVLTIIYCFLHMFLPRLETIIKEYLLRKNAPIIAIKLSLAVYQFIYQLSNIIIMMLMMTMNFWVGLAIALGCSLGYSFNGANKEWKSACKKYTVSSGDEQDSSCPLYTKF